MATYGDFSEVLFSHEKEGGQPKSQICMEKFRRTLDECRLQDLGFVGDAFTWRHHHHRATCYIRERSDRAIACGEWRWANSLVRVINDYPRHSNHVLTDDCGDWRGREDSCPPNTCYFPAWV